LTPVFDDLNRYEATTHFNGSHSRQIIAPSASRSAFGGAVETSLLSADLLSITRGYR
jgi:hypothetical protein